MQWDNLSIIYKSINSIEFKRIYKGFKMDVYIWKLYPVPSSTVWNNYFLVTLKFLIHKKIITLKRPLIYMTPFFWNTEPSIFRAIITKNTVYYKTVIWFDDWLTEQLGLGQAFFSDLLFLTLGRYFNLSERFFQLVFSLFARLDHMLYLGLIYKDMLHKSTLSGCRWKYKKWKTGILMCFPLS